MTNTCNCAPVAASAAHNRPPPFPLSFSKLQNATDSTSGIWPRIRWIRLVEHTSGPPHTHRLPTTPVNAFRKQAPCVCLVKASQFNYSPNEFRLYLQKKKAVSRRNCSSATLRQTLAHLAPLSDVDLVGGKGGACVFVWCRGENVIPLYMTYITSKWIEWQSRKWTLSVRESERMCRRLDKTKKKKKEKIMLSLYCQPLSPHPPTNLSL